MSTPEQIKGATCIPPKQEGSGTNHIGESTTTKLGESSSIPPVTSIVKETVTKVAEKVKAKLVNPEKEAIVIHCLICDRDYYFGKVEIIDRQKVVKADMQCVHISLVKVIERND